jgi:hypothetical protein
MKTNFSNDGMAYNLNVTITNDGMAYNLNVTITNDAIRLYLLFL